MDLEIVVIIKGEIILLFCRLTWRLGGITFSLTTETRLNFQQSTFPGVYFDK